MLRAAAATAGSVSLQDSEDPPSSGQLLKLSRVLMKSLPLSDQPKLPLARVRLMAWGVILL
jgi:hypothetical protein